MAEEELQQRAGLLRSGMDGLYVGIRRPQAELVFGPARGQVPVFHPREIRSVGSLLQLGDEGVVIRRLHQVGEILGGEKLCVQDSNPRVGVRVTGGAVRSHWGYCFPEIRSITKRTAWSRFRSALVLDWSACCWAS